MILWPPEQALEDITAEEEGHLNRISSLGPRYLWAVSSHMNAELHFSKIAKVGFWKDFY